MNPFLNEALGRLDRWLVEVCNREERRAARLAPNGAAGWSGVRAMATPAVGMLAFDQARADDGDEAGPGPSAPRLIPEGDHPLTRAQSAFRLDDVEAEALLVLLAPHLEPRYRALYNVLQDNLQYPVTTERVLFTVLGRTPARRQTLYRTLSESGALAGGGLVQVQGRRLLAAGGLVGPLERPIDLAPEVQEALLGLAVGPSIAGAPVSQFAVAPRTGEPGEQVKADGRPAPFAVLFGVGEWREVAERLTRPGGDTLLATRVPDDRLLAGVIGAALLRTGALHDALPVVDLTALETDLAAAVGTELLARVSSYGGRALVVTRQPLPLAVPQHPLALAGYEDRRLAWQQQSASRGVPLSDEAAARLAGAWRLGARGVERAFDAAAETSEGGLAEAAARLADVRVRHGVRVPLARGFDDLVVRSATRIALERLVFYVQNRDRLAEQRGLERAHGLRRGPLVLFSGLSGTGKTMAAEVVAKTLRRPLWAVDLSQLVSKYIGDTEKHIEEILSDGERAGTVLFFDEADALFATRTESASNASERFANMSVGFLLQRIERHDGLVILATNLRHAVDPAFLRRFQFRVEFPLPDAGERQLIWERLLPPGVPRTADLDLAPLSERHRLSGGEIRNAALKAIFLAEQGGGVLSQAILEQAIEIELYEMGRLTRAGVRDQAEPADAGLLLRRVAEALEELLRARVRDRFVKEVHIVHGSPTREAIAGQRPAVSLALYRLASSRGTGLRLGFLVSAWSHRAEEELEILGVIQEALAAAGGVGLVEGRKVVSRVQESFDFDLLHRFWSSHGHPVRPSVVLDVEIG